MSDEIDDKSLDATLKTKGVESKRFMETNNGSAATKGGEKDVGSNAEDAVHVAQLIKAIIAHIEDVNNPTKKRQCNLTVTKWFAQSCSYGLRKDILAKYEVVFLLSEKLLSGRDADEIYRVFEKCRKSRNNDAIVKPVLLILYSFGGYTGNAYLIGKMLQELSGKQLEIAIPRQAKSAATLLCCAARKIHMGALSELGPIDPQMRDGPALGVKATLQHLAELAAKSKDAIPLFVGYMTKTIDPLSVGYSERVTESSMQYAERLLKGAHEGWGDEQIKGVAKRLTYEYKDHGFVIDKQECAEMFGSDVVQSYTQELEFADAMYKEFMFINKIASIRNFQFTLVGDMLGQQFSERK